jgi:hypothetical protein
MQRVTCVVMVVFLVVGGASAGVASQGKDKKHGKPERASRVADADTQVAVTITFGSADVRVIRRHYEPRYRNLPPGLQKKVARGGELPPGWKKKLEPFPVELERELPVLPNGYRRGVIDGHAVIYDSRTNVVIDVAVLF